ncbi:MAG TPA: hypothetical protein VIH27_05605 [Nitrososphaerales archaeon]
MVESIVIKFGGSVLQDEVTMKKAADMVSRVINNGLRPVIVVSALKGATDNLLSLSRKINPDTPNDILDQVLSMGERTSARLFTSAIISKGLKPTLVDPEFENWPIVTDENHLDANPIYDETERQVQRKIRPMLEAGEVPVVCGFLGKTRLGIMTTLGRGGSDTTAILLGSCLNSKEIVLVKDVEMIFSSDPDVVKNPVPLKELNSEEAFLLSAGGAKFLHSKAMSYNRNGVRIRIASLQETGEDGTIIDGGAVDLVVELLQDPITMITVIGDKPLDTEQIRFLMTGIKESGGSIISLTLDPKTTVLYISGGINIVDQVHNMVIENKIGKALSFFENLRVIVVRGSALETVPGLIQRVTQPLARKNINIFGLLTIGSSIRIVVLKASAEPTVALLKTALLSAS